jgi:hypothetical protein
MRRCRILANAKLTQLAACSVSVNRLGYACRLIVKLNPFSIALNREGLALNHPFKSTDERINRVPLVLVESDSRIPSY